LQPAKLPDCAKMRQEKVRSGHRGLPRKTREWFTALPRQTFCNKRFFGKTPGRKIVHTQHLPFLYEILAALAQSPP
jgi:hypothetical protein